MRRRMTFGVLLLLAIATMAYAAGELKPGTAVFAEWVANGWYHGKIDKKCDAGWHIAFDDGDQKCCTTAQIVADVVPAKAAVAVGAKVLAQWTTGKYYPGKVSAINGANYAIAFDDGDNGTVKLEQIRLRK
ncbi:MAG: DUF4537 domain-containing protein [Deltaproteobacteria bacterium]|nr:DUF4537 domain-containing protein [Deltaproteobacteria bacterium]